MIDHHYTNSEEIIIIGDLNIDKMRVDKSVCTGLCDVYGLNIIKGPIFLKSKIKDIKPLKFQGIKNGQVNAL